MRWSLPLLLLLLLLAGCGGAAQAPAAGPSLEAATAPASAPAGTGYPYPYPNPQAAEDQGARFTLNAPLLTNQEAISGTGPAGVPIRLVNFMRDAAVIGETVIGPDGTFSVPVTGISKGDIIGVALGDLTGTDLNADDFVSGPGYKDVSGFGVVFASQVVLE